MEYAAIRHFADKRYCYAMAKGRFLIRLEVKKGDAAEVTLHTQNKYLPIRYMDTRQEYPMEIACSDNLLDYYEAELDMDVVCLRYFFEIKDREGNVAYYGNHGFYDTCITDIDRMFDCPQTLREEERFELPAWAENKVIYQIFPARFATEQEIPEESWYQAPIGGRADLKGSLRGIINHFDHIRNLGVDILYMTPIFSSDSVHKYNIDDYYRIDPSFGDKEDLKVKPFGNRLFRVQRYQGEGGAVCRSGLVLYRQLSPGDGTGKTPQLQDLQLRRVHAQTEPE